MFFVLLALVAVGGVTGVLWMERRRGRDFRARMGELHQERVRFWRALVRAGEQPADAPELRMRAQRHHARVRALADELRTHHRDASAGSWVATPEFAREEREMADALATSRVDREAALARVAHANAEIAALRGASAGATPLRPVLVHGVVGAVLGACVGFLVPYRFAGGFYLEESAAPLVTWTVAAALAGFMIGALGREEAWTHLLSPDVQGRSVLRVVVPALIGVAVTVVFYAFWFGPPSAARTETVLAEMAARARCPRPVPTVAEDSVPGLTGAERCALVWTAASAIPPTEATRAFVERGDTARVRVLRLAEVKSSRTVYLLPGYGFRARNVFAWNVTFALNGGIYLVSVDQRTGAARLRLSGRR